MLLLPPKEKVLAGVEAGVVDELLLVDDAGAGAPNEKLGLGGSDDDGAAGSDFAAPNVKPEDCDCCPPGADVAC